MPPGRVLAEHRRWMPSEGQATLVGFGWLLDGSNRFGQEDRGVRGWLVGVVAGVLLPASLDLQPGVGRADDRVAADGHPQGGGVGRTAADGKAGQQIPVLPRRLVRRLLALL
jgi:hypothetical protein